MIRATGETLAVFTPTPLKRFATTSWSLIRLAQAPRAGGARTELYRRYWGPVAGFLSRLGVRRDQVEDITQGFFLSLEERNDLVRLDPARGGFRKWLRVSARHYLLRVRAREARWKAGGRANVLSLDATTSAGALGALTDAADPEQLACEREAMTILTRADAQLRQWYEDQGKLELYRALAGCLLEEDDRSDEQIAEKLGKTSGAVRQDRFRMRARFADCVRAVLRSQGVPDAAMRERLTLLESALAKAERGGRIR
jgi:RNA polymerase sigma factor (sigma-70 family)